MQIHELNNRSAVAKSNLQEKKIKRKDKDSVPRTATGAAALDVRDLPAHIQQQIAQKMQPDTGRPNPYMTPAARVPTKPENFGGTQGYGQTKTNAPIATVPAINTMVPTGNATTAQPTPAVQKVTPQSWAGQNVNVPAAVRKQQAQAATQQTAPVAQPTATPTATPAAQAQPTSVQGQRPTLAQRVKGFVSSSQQGINRRYDRANPNNNAWADIPGSVGDAQKTSQERAQKLMKLASPATQQRIAAAQAGTPTGTAPQAVPPTTSASPQSVLAAISPTQLTRRNLQAAGQILQQSSSGNTALSSTGNQQVDTMLTLMGFTVT